MLAKVYKSDRKKLAYISVPKSVQRKSVIVMANYTMEVLWYSSLGSIQAVEKWKNRTRQRVPKIYHLKE